jgi:F420-dependent oxidoreductase-like protein
MSVRRKIGAALMGGDSREVLRRIERAEDMGIQAAWLTTAAPRHDGLTMLAAAAAQTKRILLGTSIIPTWPRHPIVVVQQVRVIADLAPGRMRLGIGVSHKPSVESMFGFEYNAPLAHLHDYLQIVKPLLQQGRVDYTGRYYQAHAETGVKLDVPVMAAALRRRSFELCGAEADGAITWVCPGQYIKQVAIPALRSGASKAGRPVPPLIAHVPVCVHENRTEALIALREQLAIYPTLTNYAQMFVDAGFKEVLETKAWSDRMVNSVALFGSESEVKKGLLEMFDYGATEVLVTPVPAGPDKAASNEHIMNTVVEVARTIEN